MLNRCIKCEIEKPDDAFEWQRGLTGNLSRRTTCKACRNLYRRDRYLMNKGREDDTRKERLFKRHGISSAIWNQIFESQGRRCAICRTDGTDGKLTKRYIATGGWATDHDHKTLEVRGILCPPCNTAIGHCYDNPEILENAAAYLRGSLYRTALKKAA